MIFDSDNGPDSEPYDRLETFDHASIGMRRDIKTEVFEGGRRVPLIVRWPGEVGAGTQSDQLVSFTDWFATVAAIALQDQGAADSTNLLPLLRGVPQRATRKHDSPLHPRTFRPSER